jgi:hypothetical protein
LGRGRSRGGRDTTPLVVLWVLVLVELGEDGVDQGRKSSPQFLDHDGYLFKLYLIEVVEEAVKNNCRYTEGERKRMFYLIFLRLSSLLSIVNSISCL